MSFLFLANGTVFPGESIGAKTHSVEEVVFNTSFQGHPEANPGPNELLLLFTKFISKVSHAKKH